MTGKRQIKANSSLAEKELDKAAQQFEDFDSQVKKLTLDRMNDAPKKDMEPQTKIAQKDLKKCEDIYLKPIRQIGSAEKFNERFRDEYEFQKEYVRFIAENKEVIGESIDIWTKPFPGVPAQEWIVPCNRPLNGPRFLAEQLKKASYHVLKMEENKSVGSDHNGSYYGQMAVQSTVQRLDALPVSNRKSVFISSGV